MSIATSTPIAANEIKSKLQRRKFNAKYKAKIVTQLDACSSPSDKGALLRKEGLYSSIVTKWKQQAKTATLDAFAKKRGPNRNVPLK